MLGIEGALSQGYRFKLLLVQPYGIAAEITRWRSSADTLVLLKSR